MVNAIKEGLLINLNNASNNGAKPKGDFHLKSFKT